MPDAWERLSKANTNMSNAFGALQRLGKTVTSQNNQELRLQMAEDTARRSVQQQQWQQHQALWNMRLQAEDEWQRRQLGAVQFMLERADKATMDTQHRQDLQRDLLEKAMPTAQQIQANRNMKMALRGAAKIFDGYFKGETFNPDEAAGHTKWTTFTNYYAPQSQKSVARIIESLGNQPYHYDNFLRAYAKMTPEERVSAVDSYVAKNGTQEGMDPNQREVLAQSIDQRLATVDPSERRLWQPYLQDWATSRDSFVRARLGPYADLAAQPPPPLGGGEVSADSGPSSGPFRRETSGEVTAAVPVQTAPHTFTNIVQDASGTVNKPALKKYDALYGLTQGMNDQQLQQFANRDPEGFDKWADKQGWEYRMTPNGPPVSKEVAPGTTFAGDGFSSKVTAWTQSPGFKPLLQDVLTGAHDPNDAMERIYRMSEAVYAEGNKNGPISPEGVKQTAGVIFNAARNMGLLSGGESGSTRLPFPQTRAIMSRP